LIDFEIALAMPLRPMLRMHPSKVCMRATTAPVIRATYPMIFCHSSLAVMACSA